MAHLVGSIGVSSGGPTANDLRNDSFNGTPFSSSQARSMTRVYFFPSSSTGPASSRGLRPRFTRPGSNSSVNRLPSADHSSSSSSRNGYAHLLVAAEQLDVLVRAAAGHRGGEVDVPPQGVLRQHVGRRVNLSDHRRRLALRLRHDQVGGHGPQFAVRMDRDRVRVEGGPVGHAGREREPGSEPQDRALHAVRSGDRRRPIADSHLQDGRPVHFLGGPQPVEFVGGQAGYFDGRRRPGRQPDLPAALRHRPRLRLRAGGLAVELRHQPVEAVEVVAQPLLGVVLGVADDPQSGRGSRWRGSSSTTRGRGPPGRAGRSSGRPCRRPFTMPLRFRQSRCGLHRLEVFREPVEVVVAVVQVVDDADVRPVDRLDDARPGSPARRPSRRGCTGRPCGRRSRPHGPGVDPGRRLFQPAAFWAFRLRVGEHHPELRPELVLLEGIEQEPTVLVRPRPGTRRRLARCRWPSARPARARRSAGVRPASRRRTW